MSFRSKEAEKAYKKWYYENVAKPLGKNKLNYEKHKEARRLRRLEAKLRTTTDVKALQHRRWVCSLSISDRFLYDLWKQFEFTSRSRGLVFELTYEDLQTLYQRQMGLCFYTGKVLELRRKHLMTASIDRVDSRQSYTLDNCVLCGAIINLMKLDLTVEDFQNLCRSVVNHANCSQS